MLRSDNITDLNEYLEENHRKNRERDFAFFARVASSWDPLTDSSLDDSFISLDLGQPIEKDTLSHLKPKSQRYSLYSINALKSEAKGRPKKT